jgi:uncharacterized protein YndB with AHSA1/START domain
MNTTVDAGRVEIKDNRATLTFTRLLKHPQTLVWEAITTPEEFSAWYSGKVAIDGRVGGMFEVWTGGEFHWTGKILAWEPPRLLEYEHNHVPCKVMPSGADTIVRWELTPVKEGTSLTFTQSRLKSNFGFAPAMHVFLERLEAHLKGLESPDFMQRFREVMPLYPIWKAKEVHLENDPQAACQKPNQVE